MAAARYQLINTLALFKIKKVYIFLSVCGTTLVKLQKFVIGREQFLFFIE